MIDRFDPLTIHVVCFRLDTRSYVQPQESKTVSDDDLKKLGATLRDGLQQTITNILKVSPGSEDCSSIPLDLLVQNTLMAPVENYFLRVIPTPYLL
jgi:hypothetical protein